MIDLSQKDKDWELDKFGLVAQTDRWTPSFLELLLVAENLARMSHKILTSQDSSQFTLIHHQSTFWHRQKPNVSGDFKRLKLWKIYSKLCPIEQDIVSYFKLLLLIKEWS